MAEPILAALKKQRSTNKAKLTNLVKFAKQDHAHTELVELTTRLHRVEKLMEEFTELELRIFTADPNEESDLTYEENYYTAIASLNKWIRARSLNQGVINLDTSNNDTQMGEHSQVKLPKIHIPSFSGDYSEWQSFFDMYTTTIHESPSLNAVQKFQYLKGLLRGEAAILLRHITVTEGNYIGALNKLKERYDRKKHIINTFIRTFVEQPSIHHPNAANIKRLMDTSDEVIRGLKALGEVGDTRDPWLIYLLLQKLDDKSKAAWAEHSADTVNPEFSEFLKFLSRRIDTLESLISTSKRSNPKTEIKGHFASENTDGEVSGYAAAKSTTYQCAMCQDKGHSIFQCSEFQAMDANTRKQFAKRTNRCFNCLSSNHPIFRCTSKYRCQRCGKKHNTLLHQEETASDSAQGPQATSSEVFNGHSQNTGIFAILPTALVDAVDYSGNTMPCRALLDSGSQASFITESCVQRLRLVRRNARISVSGLGQASSGTSKGLVTIILKPKLFPEITIEALVMSKIAGKIPTESLYVNVKSYAGLKLADPHFHETGNIDILIGADHFFNLLQNGKVKSGPNEPILQNTVFGWIVSGQPGHSRNNNLVSMFAISNQQNDVVDIDRSLRRFWELESLNNQEKILSPEEAICENHFIENTTRSSQGRFIVKLPFKKSANHLGESLSSAVQRLRGVERRFTRDPTFAKMYRDFMAEYQQLNHMVEVSPPKPNESQFYLPHHGVLKTSNNTTKMRVVFDGSSKSSTGISLNDCLAVGPTVQSGLYAIILRFREHKVAFSADVEKMYRQVTVSPEDTKYHRIVWRPDPSQPIRHFELQTVTYGLASAAFLATRALKKVADDNKNSAVEASHVISKDIYVDDLMTGADNEDEALQLKEKVAEILIDYGFHLRKWKSNSTRILQNIPDELQESNNKEIQDNSQLLAESVKVLGINWNPKTDSFTFTAQVPDYTTFTKRTVLSEASRLFDPLGWLSPVVIAFKIFLQMLWGANLEWDDPLPTDKHALWNQLRTTSNALVKFLFLDLSKQQRVPELTYMASAMQIIRLIKRDLRINAGAKNILAAISPDAFEAFQISRDLKNVVEKFSKDISSNVISGGASPVKKGSGVRLMSPISPMLAEACKSVEKAITKYPQGFYSEIKYDGERVQLHKQGNEFKFFSRNLKPVSDHKINRCEEFIPKAFPSANDLILDSEILMVNTKTGELLPFGTLGKHKKTQFDSAEVCLFIFDCIYYNGEDLTKRPLKERRKILEQNICPIKNHVQLSEYQFVTSAKELKKIIAEVLQKGLEGLVLKNINGLYEPGKRHWLKVKKDYLFDGKMADTADLVVLGGWFGTGKAGGMLSIFLMGCYDKNSKIWKTVTKVHSGLDDKTMEELQGEFKKLMTRHNHVDAPKWLMCKKSMIPDYIAVDPLKMPVWEITGAEFSKSDIHTADGISIRFPRITRFRDDKSPKTATNLQELRTLFDNSKDHINLKLLTSDVDEDDDDDDGDNKGGGTTKAMMAGPSSLLKVKNEPKRTIKDEKKATIKKIKQNNMDNEDESRKQIAVTKKADDDDDDDDIADDEHKQNLNLDEKLNKKKRYYNRDIVKKEKICDADNSDDDDDYGDKKMIIDAKLKTTKRKTSEDTKLEHNSPVDDSDDDEDDDMNQNNQVPTANIKVIPKSENKSKKMKYLFEDNESGNGDDSNVDSNNDDDDKIDENTKKIFDGIKLFISSNDVYDSLRKDLKVFQLFGGRLTNKSKNCNYALHENDSIREDITVLRQKFSPSCRHVKSNWLPNCIKEKKILDIQKYPVMLTNVS